MKKLAMLTAVVLVLTCVLACAVAEEPADALAALKAKGTITIACEGTYSPWNYEDENGQLTGYDIEVAAAVCEKLGIEARFVTDLWDGLFAGLQSGRFDLVINGVDITEERQAD